MRAPPVLAAAAPDAVWRSSVFLGGGRADGHTSPTRVARDASFDGDSLVFQQSPLALLRGMETPVR